MKQKKRKGKAEDEKLTRQDIARLVGILLLLGAFLMLTFTPQVVFRASNRDGYMLTKAEMLSEPGRNRSIRIRVASSGEEVVVRRTSFDGIARSEPVPIWYNQSARLIFGLTLFDERVVSAQRQPELPNFLQAFIAVLLNILLGVVGSHLVFGSPRLTFRRAR